jgi:hypothetical protein
MFTVTERTPLHASYFKLVAEQGNYAVVISKNTRDTWRLRVEGGWIVTAHMPRGQKRYHHQCRSISVASAVKKIRKHDEYVLRHRPWRSK